jgi:hypothetical protein
VPMFLSWWLCLLRMACCLAGLYFRWGVTEVLFACARPRSTPAATLRRTSTAWR